jgi:hypothetical protein
MEKLDLRKELKNLYTPSSKEVQLVEVPPFNFVMVDGAIEPGRGPGTSPGFQEAMSALYGISYTLKFKSKLRKENPLDYTVMALEGLWWIESGDFNINIKDNWLYRVMILQLNHITPQMYAEALQDLKKKKPSPGLERLRFESFHEGLCMQILHVGRYADEPATVEKMEHFAAANAFVQHGLHHEIYLGNPLLADPAKLKTILRRPIKQ